ncbi:hypothetical protein [Vibrio phage BONAISHI]|nr:hypothetical protein [Vibrio phage BONAISHI]
MKDSNAIDRYNHSLDMQSLLPDSPQTKISLMKWAGPSDFSYDLGFAFACKNPDVNAVTDKFLQKLCAIYGEDNVQVCDRRDTVVEKHPNPEYKDHEMKMMWTYVKTPNAVFRFSAENLRDVSQELHTAVTCGAGGCNMHGREHISMICDEMNEHIQGTQMMDNEDKPMQTVNFVTLTMGNDGNILPITEVINSNELIDSKSYMYPFIDTEMMYDLYHEGTENVLVLSGKSGTGKTSLARRIILELARRESKGIVTDMMHNQPYRPVRNVVYIKDESILKLDAVYAQLQQLKPLAILLDDMDQGLQPRFLDDMSEEVRELVLNGANNGVNNFQANHNETMNKLLSYSDGALKHKTRIIITTNRGVKKGNIEPALVRTGRCFEVLDIPELTYDEALEVWTVHLQKPTEGFVALFGDAEQSPTICQAELKRESDLWTKVGKRGFLKRNDISIRSHIGGDAVRRARRDEYNEAVVFEDKSQGMSRPGERLPIGGGWNAMNAKPTH